MTIEGLSAASIAPFIEIAPIRPQGAAGIANGVDFATTLERELGALNQKVETAGQSLTDLASGESGNLHRVMLDLEQAKLSFQLAVQVRNKLLEGYQELMRMQI